MIIQFKVANFRSFYKEQVFSMVSNGNKELEGNAVFNLANSGMKLLTAGAIYGANASGKSNLVKALAFMKNFTLNSLKENVPDGSSIGVEKFELMENNKRPSLFELVFTTVQDDNELIYRYGFEVNSDEILKEYLYVNEKNAFLRNKQVFKVDRRRIHDPDVKQRITRKDTLFLSALAATNTKVAVKILNFFSNEISIINGMSTDIGLGTKDMIRDESLNELIVKNLQETDLAIKNLAVHKVNEGDLMTSEGEKLDLNELPEPIKADILNRMNILESTHSVYNNRGESVGKRNFLFEMNESVGTQEFLRVLGPIIRTLYYGGTIVIDELGAALHPLMATFVIKQFWNQNNKEHAQLIFNTQNTTTMSNDLLRRDQIWFAEKDNIEATHLSSLADYKNGDSPVRSDVIYQKNYLAGRFGAIPIIKSIKRGQENDKS